jgi:hypothetical protein
VDIAPRRQIMETPDRMMIINPYRYGSALAETEALVARFTTPPTAGRKAVINTAIGGLIDAGIWTLLDWCYFLAAADSQAALLNWKAASFDATIVNAMAFAADDGFTSDGSTSYLTTGWVPSTHGVNYTQNSASFGAYSRTNAAANGQQIMGAGTMQMDARRGSGVCRVQVNRNTNTDLAITSSLGLIVGDRPDANNQGAYHNGTSLGTAALTSSGVPSVAVLLGCRNNAGTPADFSTRQLAFAFAGASLDSTKQAALATIVEAYMDAVGAGVV